MSRFITMPKVELHLHLEGAIPIAALWQLIEAQGGHPQAPSPEAVEERFHYRDFKHFIETWVWKNQFLNSYQAFEFAAEAVASQLAADNVRYAEVFFSPTDFEGFSLTPAELALSIRRGLNKVSDTKVVLIVDLVRDTGPGRPSRTFDQIREVAVDAEVIGVGIGGSEAEFPPEPFADVYARAASAGFRLTAHAGEAAGPESVWGALRELRVERIGHGIRSIEDAELVRHLADHQVPLEVCPTSNLRTGVVSDWASHPVGNLLEAGAFVTINTDDPAMFDCSLSSEYQLMADRFSFDDRSIAALAANAIDASWADRMTRRRLHRELARWWVP